MFNFLRVGGTLSGQYDGLGEGDLFGNFGSEDLYITYTAGSGNDVALYTVPEPTTLLLALLALVGTTLRVSFGAGRIAVYRPAFLPGLVLAMLRMTHA